MASLLRFVVSQRRWRSTAIPPGRRPRVAVCLSGGVDSTMVAMLLKLHGGYDLVGVHMECWDPAVRDDDDDEERMNACMSDGAPCSRDLKDASAVARALDIPFQAVDLSREYWNRVFEPTVKGVEARTSPNPDVLCNTHIKFGALMDHLPFVGASSSPGAFDFIATGHYARAGHVIDASFVAALPDSVRGLLTTSEGPAPAVLRRALSAHNDQSYFLSQVPPHRLQRLIAPLGYAPGGKAAVRAALAQLAEALPAYHRQVLFSAAGRPTSTGLCFVGRQPWKTFIAQHLPPDALGLRSGPIFDVTAAIRFGGPPTLISGHTMHKNVAYAPELPHAAHQGTSLYTLGERIDIWPGPRTNILKAFVAYKDVAPGACLDGPGLGVVVGASDDPALGTTCVLVRWAVGGASSLPFDDLTANSTKFQVVCRAREWPGTRGQVSMTALPNDLLAAVRQTCPAGDQDFTSRFTAFRNAVREARGRIAAGGSAAGASVSVVTLDQPHRSVTPGQAIVLYDADGVVAASGWVDAALPSWP